LRFGKLLALGVCVFLLACAYKPVLNAEPISIGREGLEQYWILNGMKVIDYPQSARRRGIEGRVDVACLIDSNGRVAEAEVVEAAPVGVFERKALDAARSMRFWPAPTNREMRPVRTIRVFEYRLPGGAHSSDDRE
jgi:TonB family protein